MALDPKPPGLSVRFEPDLSTSSARELVYEPEQSDGRMQQRASVLALVAFALVGGVTLWRLVGNEPTPPSRAAAAHFPASPPAGSERGVVSSPKAGPTERGPEANSRPAPVRRQPEGQRRAFDRLRADGIRQRAAGASAALRAKAPAATAPTPPSALSPAAAPPPTTPEEEERRRQYIREAVREQYFPIARSCYQELLDRQPTASGKVVMSFAIVGDGEDGVVDRVELGDDTTMDDPELILCMRESMYSTIFEPPPPGAEETTVVYPIELEPGPREEGTNPPHPVKVIQNSR